ncbi:MAG: hypothetical protein KKE39_11705 [Bacteroidetes bacterium]|nr:hypothetical protein [Bacteroidota bacterium]MBU1372820.1 hypothetical protein [Bacteroidota bacterium]MBU1485549.1 hypothetical protein [Bacteroidota bacterium]MBU1760561.1 hypothetical protein [Bacteroidota bacterium]MBU2267923.1 hypothetical protein [Bacteroidota bacterium]
MKHFITICLSSFLSISGYSQIKIPFVSQIEKANQSSKFHEMEAISFHIELVFGDKKAFEGAVISATNSSFIKIIKADGTTLTFDGNKVWLSPLDKNYKGARFDMFTWQYFFMAPFKFSDNGTKWENLGEKAFNDEMQLSAAKLTFENGTGDASGDYYYVYKNAQNLVAAMGYIVTFGGRSVEQAEKGAHAIEYSDYQKVNGVSIAMQWAFHNWNKEKGIGDKIGDAKITNVKFVTISKEDMKANSDAVEVKM